MHFDSSMLKWLSAPRSHVRVNIFDLKKCYGPIEMSSLAPANIRLLFFVFEIVAFVSLLFWV